MKKKKKAKWVKDEHGNLHCVINPNELKTRNIMHFEVQKNTRMQIVESKKHKKPKYKKDWLNED